MKTEFADLSETKKSVAVEIPSDIVDAQIDRVARSYSRQARIPGFRQGKVPPTLIKKRFREQILHDVAHDLIPRAIDEALRERGLEPVDTPDVKDVTLDEGQALTFTATFETLPPIDPGPLNTISLRRPAVTLEENAVEQTLTQLQNRAARYEPVEGRGIEDGDTVTLDVRAQRRRAAGRTRPEHHHDVVVEIGGKANPPGFDDELRGLEAGAKKTFTIHYPDDYAVKEMAGTSVEYSVAVKDLRKRVLPALDDEFAKDVGEFETPAGAARSRVRDLQREAEAEADRNLRGDLMKQLAARVDGRHSRVARRARARSAHRRVRAAPDGPEHRSPAREHRLGSVPRQPARGEPRVGEERAGARRDLAPRERDGVGRGCREGRGAVRGAQRTLAGGGAGAARKRRRVVASVGRPSPRKDDGLRACLRLKS